MIKHTDVLAPTMIECPECKGPGWHYDSCNLWRGYDKGWTPDYHGDEREIARVVRALAQRASFWRTQIRAYCQRQARIKDAEERLRVRELISDAIDWESVWNSLLAVFVDDPVSREIDIYDAGQELAARKREAKRRFKLLRGEET